MDSFLQDKPFLDLAIASCDSAEAVWDSVQEQCSLEFIDRKYFGFLNVSRSKVTSCFSSTSTLLSLLKEFPTCWTFRHLSSGVVCLCTLVLLFMCIVHQERVCRRSSKSWRICMACLLQRPASVSSRRGCVSNLLQRPIEWFQNCCFYLSLSLSISLSVAL